MLCVKCNKRFSYKEKLLAIWKGTGYSEITCRKCKEKYKISKLSRLIISMLIPFPILFINLIQNKLIFYIAYMMIIIFISPFFAKFNTISG